MTFLIVLHFLVCAFLVAVILIQPGKSDGGIGFGSSSSQSIFGSKAAGNFLTRTTSICAIIFLTTSFFLTRSRMQEYSKSVINPKSMPAQEAPLKPDQNKPAAAQPGDASKQVPAKAEPVKVEPTAKAEPVKAPPTAKAEPAKAEKK